MTTDPMYADLFTSLACTLINDTHRPARATIGLYWANTRPAELTLSIRCGESYEVWTVARSTLIAASEDWACGAWVGAGWYACYFPRDRDSYMRMSFREGTQTACVVALSRPVEEFIKQTRALVDCGPAESEITLRRVDEAIAQILEGAE